MTDQRFLELHKETVRNVINPLRRQISLSEMIHDAEISESMREPQSVLAISKASKACRGQLELCNTGYVLHVRSNKLNVANNQPLVIVFKSRKREYFVQVRTKEVFSDRINLAPINPRFYHRIGLKSRATVCFLSSAEVEKLTKGDVTVRRSELNFDDKRKIHFFARDIVKGQSSKDFQLHSQDSMIMATMVDLSRGGCALSVSKIADPAAAIGSVGFMNCSVKWGKRLGNYSCFVVVKSAEFDVDGVKLRCAFFEPLTFLPNALVDGAREFDIDSGGAKEIVVNGEVLPKEKASKVKLPCGSSLITVVWPDSHVVDRVVDINEKSDRILKISSDEHVEKSA